MRASFEDIRSRKGNQSFVAYHLNVPAFPFKWHYHPEYELTFITKGSGKRLVGDSHENFEAGDLVLIGPGLPHTWVSHRVRKNSSSAVVIQFSEEFINSFLQHPEFSDVAKLLAGSGNGLFFPYRARKKIAEEIKLLPDKKGVEKITTLLMVLQQLATGSSVKLASTFFSSVKGVENEKRINRVCQYVQKHAGEKISLQKAADMIHLSDTAFCKFFKRATGKTFSDYVNDIRIGLACSLLTESDKTVNEIAYQCGFESLTYFNRVFLKKKNARPREFRNRVLQF
jgi:AraC-like DNA-binding protein